MSRTFARVFDKSEAGESDGVLFFNVALTDRELDLLRHCFYEHGRGPSLEEYNEEARKYNNALLDYYNAVQKEQRAILVTKHPSLPPSSQVNWLTYVLLAGVGAASLFAYHFITP